MNKKVTVILMAMLLLMIFMTATAASKVEMVLLRQSAEQLRYIVEWNHNTKTATLINNKTTASVKVGASSAIVNGENFVFSDKPYLKNGRLYVPKELLEILILKYPTVNDPLGKPEAKFGDPDTPIDVTIRAAQDGKNIAINVQWESNKNFFGNLHSLKTYNGQGWSGVGANEDRVTFNFAEPGAIDNWDNMGCYAVCHDTMVGMPKEDEKLAEHNIIGGEGLVDMWHYRGARSGPSGYAEDTWIQTARHRDSVGDNASTTLRGGGDRLREDNKFDLEWKYNGAIYLLPTYVFDPAVNSGFYFLNDGSALVTADNMANKRNVFTIEAAEAGKIQHGVVAKVNALYVPDLSDKEKDAIAAEVAAGAILPGTVIFVYDSDQHDITANRAFDAETNTISITLKRALDTGSKNDANLAGLLAGDLFTFGLAVHDNDGHASTHRIAPALKLGGAEANVVIKKVESVDNVNWANVSGFITTAYVPRTATGTFLLSTGHMGYAGLQSGMTCLSCHQAGDIANNLVTRHTPVAD